MFVVYSEERTVGTIVTNVKNMSFLPLNNKAGTYTTHDICLNARTMSD